VHRDILITLYLKKQEKVYQQSKHNLYCHYITSDIYFCMMDWFQSEKCCQTYEKQHKLWRLLTLTGHMHYIYLTADMNMVTMTTLWLFSSRSTHRNLCFQTNKCTSSRSTIIMNSSPNNIWTSTILCLTSFIQILHVITHLTPNSQSHAFQRVLSQPVQETATYRASTF